MTTEEIFILWGQARSLLSQRDETNNPMAEAYLDYLIPVSMDDSNFIFATRLSVAKQWIETHYLTYIKESLFSLLEYPREITFIVKEDTPANFSQSFPNYIPSNISSLAISSVEKKNSSQPSLSSEPLISQIAPPQSSFSEINEFQTSSNINTNIASGLNVSGVNNQSFLKDSASSFVNINTPEHTAISHFKENSPSFIADQNQTSIQTSTPSPSQKTFDSFVVGDSNNFAFGASQGVAEMPGLRFNPLFIYGRSGLGKTHLLLAIKEFINRYHPNKKTIYAPTSMFVDDFTSAMASVAKDLSEFRQKYYTCDVLLLDDVQILEGKESTTNALFDIFNIFIDRQKQIVLSADRAPNELALDERYTSRFGQGLTAGIQPPSHEMKMAIFANFKKYYCSLLGKGDITIPQDVTNHIISLSGSNIRELEGAAQSICFAISSRKDNNQIADITIEDAEHIVGKVFFRGENKSISIKAIQLEVEQHFNVSHSDLIGSRRSHNITYPRQVAMYLARRLTNKSYPEIVKYFGNKHHTTAVYAYNNVEREYMLDNEKKLEIERLAERIMQ
jgi:chromosomal replication initiator protein